MRISKNNWNYVDAAIGMSEPGTCIIVDNVVRKGSFALEGTGDAGVEGARKVWRRLERIAG